MDKNTAPWDIKESSFYTNPEDFLKLGQRVRARVRVYDLPGNPDPGMIHAEVGETGVVIHVEKGFWPTVQFDRTGTRTDVMDFEVEPLPAEVCGCEP